MYCGIFSQRIGDGIEILNLKNFENESVEELLNSRWKGQKCHLWANFTVTSKVSSVWLRSVEKSVYVCGGGGGVG